MKPSKGRIVLYTFADWDRCGKAGVSRPAMIVETWGNETTEAFEMGSAVNLQVFADGSNDNAPIAGFIWKTSVLYSESPRPGCWSWPPRV